MILHNMTKKWEEPGENTKIYMYMYEFLKNFLHKHDKPDLL